MTCRFENRLAGQALEMRGLRGRYAAQARDELPDVFAAIRRAQDQGCWTALLLNYELGEWLEPDVNWSETPTTTACPADTPGPVAARDAPPRACLQDPRITALVYDQAVAAPVWPEPATSAAVGLHSRASTPRATYIHRVQGLRASIARGELYQANYTIRLALDVDAPPRELYRRIAAAHPSAHAAYIEDGARRILSFSPELFFERRGHTITTRPMKGTAPRHPDLERDLRAARELQASEKNRAENVMIVDLLRNDLGRLATPGSVSVDRLFALERYPSVWTLTSTISAQAPGHDLESLLRALFPCGSVTGAPKIAAMRKIRLMETAPRGIYCGSVGWLAPNGDCSLNVAIRTIEMHDDRHGVFGVGGGIVHDSDPELEWEECLWKSRLLATAPPGPARTSA
ncbi:MAG: aminodeoxychorismate synthase component I [Candidimonas sp.]